MSEATQQPKVDAIPLDADVFGLMNEVTQKVLRERHELLEAWITNFVKESEVPVVDLCLYEEQEKPADKPEVLRIKWFLSSQNHDAIIIKNFLDRAAAFFQEELDRLKSQYPAGEEMPLSHRKAIEGARWTLYHTNTLRKYHDANLRQGIQPGADASPGRPEGR